MTSKASIFTTELVTLNLALDIIWRFSASSLLHFWILCHVRWPFITAVLKQDMSGNLLLTVASWLIRVKLSSCAGFQVIPVIEVMSMLIRQKNQP